MKQDAHTLIQGREKDVLAALGISWPPPKGKHIRCPFPEHDDHDPSWRWDDAKRAWTCTCADGYKSIYDAVMRMNGFDFVDAVRWVKDAVLGNDPAARKTSPKERREQAKAEREEAAAKLAAGQGELARYLRKAGPVRAVCGRLHAYLTVKGIQPHGALLDGAELLIPMQASSGEVRNLQRIFIKDIEAGGRYTFTKKFIVGLPTNGLFHFIGSLPAERIAFAEGFATGASVKRRRAFPSRSASRRIISHLWHASSAQPSLICPSCSPQTMTRA